MCTRIKRQFIILITLALCSCTPLKSTYNAKTQEKEALLLIERTIGEKSSHFITRIIPEQYGEQDFFRISTSELHGKQKILLEGNNGVSIASAFNYYMENLCHCQVTWCGTNLNLPETLPLPVGVIEKKTIHKYRYYLNYCTFNYSMSWWDEERWQKEIDFMAMKGINAPLALTGQCSIWQRVYKKLGFSDDDLRPFFCAPTHFSWFWMGNLDGWGGPLPQSFIDKHEKLQKYILRQERRLGMTPILPAFTGHVPPTFQNLFPDSQVKKTKWVNFDEVCILDPNDSLFNIIGELFMREQDKVYGNNHLYSADTFNENIPPTNDSLYLSKMGRKVYESMSAYDKDAIWIMQGWMFYYSRDFWQENETKALLSGIPKDKMIILDLWSERYPVWKMNESYYGKNWIWCMLHNFGQNNTFNGNIHNVAIEPSIASKDTNMVGIGLTMEGINQMPAIYSLMLENVWNNDSIDIDSFMSRYLRNRYGDDSYLCEDAWKILNNSVFDQNISGGGFESILTARPTLTPSPRRVNDKHMNKYVKPLNSAWLKMIDACKTSKSICSYDGFKYDLVDVTRQVLAEYANIVHYSMTSDSTTFLKDKETFLELFDDMDRLLATRKEFLLGRWLEDAKQYATSEHELKQYEHNARNLVTLWGNSDCNIHDYSCRHWAGLMRDFYKKRWETLLNNSLAIDNMLDPEEYNESIKQWEWEWSMKQDSFPTTPTEDEIKVCLDIYSKYASKLQYATISDIELLH